MSTKLSMSLDEILAEEENDTETRPQQTEHNRRRREQNRQPRDGVKKSYRDEKHSVDTEWVHDKFDGNDNHRARDRDRIRDRVPAPRRRRNSRTEDDSRGTKVLVHNIHYDVSEAELKALFKTIGPLKKLELIYDRAGRSSGDAYAIYESHDDALRAIKEFNGAMAKGQHISLEIDPSNPSSTARVPRRSLEERISFPDSNPRSRSSSPHHQRPNFTEEDAARKGIDRYIPGSFSRSRSPMPRRRPVGGGRRPGERRESTARDSGSRRRAAGRDGKIKKTQEELDAEMADYFDRDEDSAAPSASNSAVPNEVAAAYTEDVDMIL